jgi:hypothetical protein
MPALDPTSPFRPRIEGLARAHWTRTQLTLRESAEAIDLLDRAEIPCLVIKGAAQYAEGLGAATRRILGDIDILVRAENAPRAIELLASAGWAGTFGESAAYLRSVADIRISTTLLKGRYGEIDVHRTPFHYRRADPAADELLWAGAQSTHLNGHPVMVPSPAASILISLAHSIQGEGGDWAVDVAERLRHQAIDWDCFAELATRWRLTLSMRSGLLYLKQQLGLTIPAEIIERLAVVPADWAERLKFWSNVREHATRPLADRIANRIADLALAARGYDLAVSDAKGLAMIQSLGAISAGDLVNFFAPGGKRLTIIPPRPLDALTFLRAGSAIGLGADAANWSTQTTVSIGSCSRGSTLAIELEFCVPPRPRWIYFDLSRDDRAFARMKTRAGGRKAGLCRRIAALVRVPPGSHPGISIEARPTKFIRPAATARVLELADALPFRVVRAALLSNS